VILLIGWLVMFGFLGFQLAWMLRPFVGDPLHGVSHRSVEIANIGPGGVKGASRHGMEAERERLPWLMVTFEDKGHGILSTGPYEVTDANADIFPNFANPVGPLDRPEIVDGPGRGGLSQPSLPGQAEIPPDGSRTHHARWVRLRPDLESEKEKGKTVANMKKTKNQQKSKH